MAITTSAGAGSTTFSVKEVLITNPGFGYTIPPTITFSGAGGSGASAIAGVGTNVVRILLDGTQVGGVIIQLLLLYPYQHHPLDYPQQMQQLLHRLVLLEQLWMLD